MGALRSFLVKRPNLRRYSVSILLVLAATAGTIAVAPLYGDYAIRVPLFLFVIAVVFSALYGGVGPGITATALAVVIDELFLEPKIFPGLPAPPNIVGFVIVGVAISVVIDWLRNANSNLKRTRVDLEHANQELSRRSESLAQANVALSRSNEELRRLAYALSHDLQTPLRNISMFTELLVEAHRNNRDDDAEQSAKFVLSGVHRMQLMIHGLLEYATANDDTNTKVPTDCDAVIQQVILDCCALIEASGAKITFDKLPTVEANTVRLTEVFSNLIENAIKYRSGQPPEIHVSSRRQDPQWEFSVKDNGIGLDMKFAEQIFGVFARLHPPDAYEGSGIGLAICAAIIERHDGRIWVESEPGNGSTFFFTLPAEPAIAVPKLETGKNGGAGRAESPVRGKDSMSRSA